MIENLEAASASILDQVADFAVAAVCRELTTHRSVAGLPGRSKRKPATANGDPLIHCVASRAPADRLRRQFCSLCFIQISLRRRVQAQQRASERISGAGSGVSCVG